MERSVLIRPLYGLLWRSLVDGPCLTHPLTHHRPYHTPRLLLTRNSNHHPTLWRILCGGPSVESTVWRVLCGRSLLGGPFLEGLLLRSLSGGLSLESPVLIDLCEGFLLRSRVEGPLPQPPAHPPPPILTPENHPYPPTHPPPYSVESLEWKLSVDGPSLEGLLLRSLSGRLSLESPVLIDFCEGFLWRSFVKGSLPHPPAHSPPHILTPEDHPHPPAHPPPNSVESLEWKVLCRGPSVESTLWRALCGELSVDGPSLEGLLLRSLSGGLSLESPAQGDAEGPPQATPQPPPRPPRHQPTSPFLHPARPIPSTSTSPDFSSSAIHPMNTPTILREGRRQNFATIRREKGGGGRRGCVRHPIWACSPDAV